MRSSNLKKTRVEISVTWAFLRFVAHRLRTSIFLRIRTETLIVKLETLRIIAAVEEIRIGTGVTSIKII